MDGIEGPVDEVTTGVLVRYKDDGNGRAEMKSKKYLLGDDARTHGVPLCYWYRGNGDVLFGDDGNYFNPH